MGVVVLIDRPGYRLASDRKVLKSKEAAVIENTAQAYLLAQGQINAALQDLEHVRTRVTEEARREGLAQAREEATRRFVLAELERRSLLEAAQPTLARILVEALELLARDIDREAILARALELLQSALREVSWACLRVHPAAAQPARTALSRFDRQTGLGRIVNVVPDESLPPGGCVLESELGRIDASMETQLENIRRALAQAASAAVEQPAQTPASGDPP